MVDRLMLMGHDVICLDNYFTGSKSNIAHWIGHPNFELIRYVKSSKSAYLQTALYTHATFVLGTM